tara:strand:- start:1797 stop:2756 length:960 start_codon:yes stop_codon:yes gene_type:complete
MITKRVKTYNSDVNSGVNNEYPTPLHSFKQCALHMIVGQRTSGKSYLTSKILAQAQKDKTFDVIYIITPSFNSNKAYFGKYIDNENVFEPTKTSIMEVIQKVDEDRDEWEEFLEEKRKYLEYKKRIHDKNLPDEDLLDYYYAQFLDGYVPKWKYSKEEPPKSLLIMDDILGSPVIMQSSGLTRIATLNRHISPLQEEHSNRSACGLSVIIMTQTYKMNQGIGRALRENVSLLTLFKNKQQKQLDAIKEELANVVDLDKFDKAYAYSTKEKYGSLTVDFNPKHPDFTFRANLNEFIIFKQDDICTCESEGKPKFSCGKTI